MSIEVTRESVRETNGDPDQLIEEKTEVLVIESDPGWRVLIEHVGCDSLIQIDCETREDAVALIDRIEEAVANGEHRIRVDPGHLISLVAFRQAWIDESPGGATTKIEPS